MEALDIFEGTFAHRWDELPPLRHLITAYFDPSLIRNPGRVFANVVSLKASTYNPPETIALIGPHLTLLQFLHLSSSGDASEEICVHDFTKISSDRLTYIHYFKNVFESKKEVAELDPVFARHPSLLAVDIDHQKAVYQPSYPSGYRFYRNTKSPIKYSIRETDMFECWWELVQESLESEQAMI
ncbi:hypothetical protein ONZ45_g14740 [Pleurotus djamor]|nr:hypothetical protein ONZ45_g14740 [Pleurotus djamor]